MGSILFIFFVINIFKSSQERCWNVSLASPVLSPQLNFLTKAGLTWQIKLVVFKYLSFGEFFYETWNQVSTHCTLGFSSFFSLIELQYQSVHKWYKNYAMIILFECGIQLTMHNTNKEEHLRKLFYFSFFHSSISL